MLLRRITQHVQDQNWFAVFIDFLIVVVGILIAFQITNWSEARSERAAEEQYLQRLHMEVETVLEQRKSRDQREESYFDAVLETKKVIQGEVALRPLTAFECNAIGSLHMMPPSVTDLPTADELFSAGRLETLQAAGLRRELVQYRQIVNRLRHLLDTMNINTIVISHLYPDIIGGRVVDHEIAERGYTIGYDCDAKAMIGNREFLSHFAENFEKFETYYRVILRGVTDQLKRLHTELDTALGITHEEMK